MAVRQKIYTLDGTVILIDPHIGDEQVWDAWKLALKRAEAWQTLYPDLYPDNDSITAKAVDELQAQHPDWQIIFVETSFRIDSTKPFSAFRLRGTFIK